MANHIYCLMGKSATGKDTIYQRLLQDERVALRHIVPYTTRPIREGEVNGREYFFTDEDGFHRLEADGKIIESRCYQTYYGPWYYFTADDGQIDLKTGSYLVIGTLESYLSMRRYFGADVVVPIYIWVEDVVRLERALQRERGQKTPKCAELCRRFLADEEDFSEEKLKDAGIQKRFENTTLDACLSEIAEWVNTSFQTS